MRCISMYCVRLRSLGDVLYSLALTITVYAWSCLVVFLFSCLGLHCLILLYLILYRFVLQFEKFADVVGVAARAQKRDVQESLVSLADTIAAGAVSTNATWPFYTLPLFEARAANTRKQARLEMISVANVVSLKNRKDWEKYSLEKIEWVYESHLYLNKHGNRSWTPPSEDDFQSVIGAYTPDGVVPQENPPESYYMPMWAHSPAPYTFDMINVDLNSLPDFRSTIKAVLELEHFTLSTKVMPFISEDAYTTEEHEDFHSEVSGVQVEHPHSYVIHPIHVIPGDKESEIVAVLIGLVAWDVSLRNLFQKGASGILAEIRNNCNQSYTYELTGADAILLGEGVYHEPKFESMEIVYDLSWNSDRSVANRDGHCLYTMVSHTADIAKDIPQVRANISLSICRRPSLTHIHKRTLSISYPLSRLSLLSFYSTSFQHLSSRGATIHQHPRSLQLSLR
jgi:hypothetical protein